MPTYEINQSGSVIKISQSGTVIETIPKEIVVLQIVLSGESQNKSGVDELWIQHDGRYSTEIPYNDVEVNSSAPSSVEDFRQKVYALLGSQTTNFPYQVYFGQISQNNAVSSGVPTLNEVYNGIEESAGVTISFGSAKVATGHYKLTPSGTWTAAKTMCQILGNSDDTSSADFVHADIFFQSSDSTFHITTSDIASGILSDDWLDNHGIVIYKFY